MSASVAFLVSSGGAVAEGVCPDGETVIPNYPSGAFGTFISAESFLVCSSAVVAPLTGARADLDAMRDKLATQFPGLPVSLHTRYVLETAVAAATIGVGVNVRLEASYDRASLVTAGGTVVTLWDKQPI